MPGPEESAQVSATPILDSGILPPRIRRKRIAGIITGVLVGLFSGLVLARVVGEQAHTGLGPRYELLLFVAMIILAITVHELGHLTAGWLLGFHFRSISIGVLSLRLEHGMLKIALRRDMLALGYAGMDIDRVRRLRRRLLFYIIAGPAANILAIPATVLLMNYASWMENTWVAVPAAQFVVLSLVFAFVSLLPRSGSLSDGTRIAMLLGSRERARRWLSAIALGKQLRMGVPAKSWKKTWVNAASSLRDSSIDEFSGNWLAYVAANDRKDVPTSSVHLERCLELAHLLVLPTRDLVAQEAAVFSAWFRSDASLAEKWVSQVKKPKLTQPLLQIRLEVALSSSQSDFPSALNHWREGAVLIEKLPATPATKRLVESWLEWQTEIQERQNGLTTKQTTNSPACAGS